MSPDEAALDRVRALAARWMPLGGVDLRLGEVLVALARDNGSPARCRLDKLTLAAESWMDPGNSLFYPAAGQCVLDAIEGNSAVPPADTWIVMIEDRHSDVNALPFSTEAAAVDAAREYAGDMTLPAGVSPDEVEHVPGEQELTPACERPAGCCCWFTASRATACASSGAPWTRGKVSEQAGRPCNSAQIRFCSRTRLPRRGPPGRLAGPALSAGLSLFGLVTGVTRPRGGPCRGRPFRLPVAHFAHVP